MSSLPAANDHVSVAELRHRFWRRLSSGQRWPYFLRAIVVCSGMIAVHLADPFGFGQAAAQRSQDIVRRFLSPWWGSIATNWAVPSNTDIVTMVLLQRPHLTTWPPTYSEQADVLAAIAGQCPAVLAIDVVYDVDRTASISLSALLAQTIAAAEACPSPPTLIFADHNSRATAADLQKAMRCLAVGIVPRMAPTQITPQGSDAVPAEDFDPMDVVDNECQEYSLSVFLGKPPRLPVAPWTPKAPILFGTVSWKPLETNAASAYSGTSNRQLYAPWASTEPATGPGQDRRATLGLQAYLAWCARARDQDLRCNKDITDWARAWVATPMAAPPDSLVQAELIKAFHRPVDLQWPRWAPPQIADYWTPESAELSIADALFGQSVCKRHETIVGTRILESLRLLVSSFESSDTLLTLDEPRATCFPYMAIPAKIVTGALDPNLPPPTEATALERYNHWRDPQLGVPRELKARVVFVGFHDVQSADIVTTPVQPRLPGMVRHAAAFDNFARLGENYYSVPKKIALFNVYENTLFEITLNILIVMAFLFYLEQKFRWNAWHSLNVSLEKYKTAQEIYQFGSKTDTAPKGYVQLLWRGCLYECIRIASLSAIMILMVIVSIVAGRLIFGWSTANWIEVGFLAALSTYLIGPPPDRHRHSATTAPSTQDQGDASS